MSAVARRALVVSGLIVLIGVTYWWAAFSTSFDLNLCYSGVLHSQSEEASAVAKSGDPAKVTRFEAFIKSLPLFGYETSCRELEMAVATYRGASVRSPNK